jgi:hypothetical protein
MSYFLCALTFAQVIWDAELCLALLLQYPGRIVVLVSHGNPNEGRGGQTAHLAPILRPHLQRLGGGDENKSAKCNIVRINKIICEKPWIRDILVRIQNLGSVPLILIWLLLYCQWLARCQLKISFFRIFFGKKELKNSKSQGFSFFLHVYGRIRIPISKNIDGSGYTILCEMSEFKFAS